CRPRVEVIARTTSVQITNPKLPSIYRRSGCRKSARGSENGVTRQVGRADFLPGWYLSGIAYRPGSGPRLVCLWGPDRLRGWSCCSQPGRELEVISQIPERAIWAADDLAHCVKSGTRLNREFFYSGKPTFLRRALRRGSSLSGANSGQVRSLPIRAGPEGMARSKASNARSLSARPAKIRAEPMGPLTAASFSASSRRPARA